MMGGVVQLDDTYLGRLRRRDPEALRSVVDEEGRRLYRAARGMGYSKNEAEDLVQDVFVTFIESIERFEGRAQVGTWLFGILHHKSQDCLDGLSPSQREVFQLRQVEELSAVEVSKISGHAITHIGVLFHRARMKLRVCLEGKGWGRSR